MMVGFRGEIFEKLGSQMAESTCELLFLLQHTRELLVELVS